jgi:hypothetical protein
MESVTVSRGSSQRPLRISILATVAVSIVLGVALASTLRPERSYILLPTLACLTLFVLFSTILKARVGDNLFGELGFLYLALAIVYTISPAFTFVILDLDLASGWVWQNLSLLLPAPYELGIHLWRHALFIAAVAAGYLLIRGRKVPSSLSIKDTAGLDERTILFLVLMLLVCLLCIGMMSAPVNNYWENYTRYDHLSFLPRKFVSLCTRVKQGFYVVLITFLFINIKKYKWTTIIVVLGMAIYEIIYTFGSRIESLIVLLMAICLYHHFVKAVTLKKGLIAFVAITSVFSALEIFRYYGFNLSQSKSVVSAQGIKPASEFGAVYFTGFHLYSERTKGTMAPKEWPMFFYDFTSLVTPNDYKRWDPQFWYARAYYPNDVVPPQTMGPIADSAIWGGEIDLIIRGLINGAFFAYLVRWFITRRDKWWAVAIYVFCYATCIITLKYSVFVQLNPLLKTFVPTILLIELMRKLLPKKVQPDGSSIAIGT